MSFKKNRFIDDLTVGIMLGAPSCVTSYITYREFIANCAKCYGTAIGISALTWILTLLAVVLLLRAIIFFKDRWFSPEN